MSTPRVVFVMGPTASGKSALAYALAEALPVEIVSVDSAQVYRGMDIGTAKPNAAERAQVPHHLIDIRDPDERFSAGEFREAALPLIDAITARSRVPLLVGGTMLYFRALLGHLDDLPKADAVLRAQIDARAEREGWPALHVELARHDAQAAARIEPNDRTRIQRALEVVLATGKPISAQWRAAPAEKPFEALQLALFPADRARLHRDIAARFESMVRGGLLDELRALRARYALDAAMTSMRCVGYRQAWTYLDARGEMSEREFVDAGIAATRQLAKRQLTWLREWPDVRYVEPHEARALADAKQEVERFMAR